MALFGMTFTSYALIEKSNNIKDLNWIIKINWKGPLVVLDELNA
jgi:hypothetical protein